MLQRVKRLKGLNKGEVITRDTDLLKKKNNKQRFVKSVRTKTTQRTYEI